MHAWEGHVRSRLQADYIVATGGCRSAPAEEAEAWRSARVTRNFRGDEVPIRSIEWSISDAEFHALVGAAPASPPLASRGALIVTPLETDEQRDRRRSSEQSVARMTAEDTQSREQEQRRSAQRQAELRDMAAASAERDARFRARDALCRANPRGCPSRPSRVRSQ